MALRPFDLIHQSIKKHVMVTMKNGNTFSGIMVSYDENLNLHLSDVQCLDNDKEYKNLILKGGNIVSVVPV